MARNWDLNYSDPTCKHSEHCGCRVTLTGKSPQVQGLFLQSKEKALSDQYRELAGQINSNIGYIDPLGKLRYRDAEIEYFKSNLLSNSTMKLISPPIENKKPWHESTFLCSVHPTVEHALKKADFRYFKHRFPHLSVTWDYLKKEIWIPTDHGCTSLQSMAMRQLSNWHWACGKSNGRMHVVAAMADLYPYKYAKAVLSMARPKIGDRPREPMKFLNEALDNMYRMMGIDLSQRDKANLSFKSCDGMYLGASNGTAEGSSYEVRQGVDEPVRVSNKGKKIDTFEQDLADIIHYIRTGERPAIYWQTPGKVENFFSRTKQWNDAEWDTFTQKMRIFNIPTGIYIHLERMVSLLRMFKERGLMIRIGHKWSKGGADTIARCLGVDLTNCWKNIIVEGDAKLYDQTVREIFVNLYFSSMTMYLDKSDPDYPMIEEMLKFLLSNMITRITQVFGELWAVVEGGVPSGAFNTSHMDSWIMALYFCLFCVWQLHNAPESVQEELEAHFFFIIRLIVYGDDHLYNKGDGVAAEYFSGQLFAEFMKKHFDVTIRDLKDGFPFCSTERHGFLVNMGATMLKHQFILNPCDKPGQPTFLPYRESWDYIVRAIWGRETKARDHVDVLLSIVGHTYGTYAANPDAYLRLQLLYVEIISAMTDEVSSISNVMMSRMTKDDLKKLRQTGVTAEEIVSGFPTWETLVEKNRVDEFYQDISRIPYDLDGDISGLGDVF